MNIQNKLNRLCIGTIKYLLFLIIFFGLKKYLFLQRIEYRLWIQVVGYMICFITPCILVGQFIKLGIDVLINKKQRMGTSAIRLVVIQKIALKIYGIISCGILLFSTILGLCNMHEEHIKEDGTLEVMYGGFPTEGYWYNYEKISFWGRQSEFVLRGKILEEKYGCDFDINTEAIDIGKIYYIPQYYPDLKVTVYNVEKKEDDYIDRYLSKIFWRGYKEHALKSECGEVSFEDGHYHFYLYDGQENLEILANDTADLISYTLSEISKDMYAPCDSGILCVTIINENGKRQNVVFYFGDSKELKEERKDADYYTSMENVYQQLLHQVSN